MVENVDKAPVLTVKTSVAKAVDLGDTVLPALESVPTVPSRRPSLSEDHIEARLAREKPMSQVAFDRQAGDLRTSPGSVIDTA